METLNLDVKYIKLDDIINNVDIDLQKNPSFKVQLQAVLMHMGENYKAVSVFYDEDRLTIVTDLENNKNYTEDISLGFSIVHYKWNINEVEEGSIVKEFKVFHL